MPANSLSISHRDIRLDVIRGIAVLLVIISHLLIPNIAPRDFNDKIFSLLIVPLKFIRTGGWAGVDLFFVLSGFLVSGLLFKEFKTFGKVNSYRFLIRRGFKIYPVFYAFLLITFLIDYLLHYSRLPALYDYTNIKDQIWLYLRDGLFISNYFPGRWSHSWSLDVEELFYLLLTLYFMVLIKLKQLNFTSIMCAWALLFICGIVFRAIAYIQHPGFHFGSQYSKSHFRLDALLFGVLFSWLYNYQPQKLFFLKRFKYWAVIISVAWLLTNFLFARSDNPWIAVVSLGINPICFGVLLIVALNSSATFLQNKMLAYIGRISYAVYLWHVFTNMCFITWLPAIGTGKMYWIIYLVGYLSLSVLIGSLFTQMIEVPFLNLRNKYFPSETN